MTDSAFSAKQTASLFQKEPGVKQGDSIAPASRKAGVSLSDFNRWTAETVDPPMNEAIINYSESKRQADRVLELIEQQIRPKVYQQIVVKLLKNNKQIVPELIELVRKYYQEAEQLRQILLDSVNGREQESITLACKSGCAHCCRLKVAVTEPELIIIREHLLDRCSEQSLEEIRRRLHQFSIRNQQCQTRREKLRVECAVLKQGQCTIYDVRPFACRAWNSTDVEVCKRYLETMEDDIPASICHYAPFDAMKKGIIRGLNAIGFDPPSEELNAGMLRQLNESLHTVAPE